MVPMNTCIKACTCCKDSGWPGMRRVKRPRLRVMMTIRASLHQAPAAVPMACANPLSCCKPSAKAGVLHTRQKRRARLGKAAKLARGCIASQRISSGRLWSTWVCMAWVNRVNTSDSSLCARVLLSQASCTSAGTDTGTRKRSSGPMMYGRCEGPHSKRQPWADVTT